MAITREKRTTPGGSTYYVKVAVPREPRSKARRAPEPGAPVAAEAVEPVAVVAAGDPSIEPPAGAVRRSGPKAK